MLRPLVLRDRKIPLDGKLDPICPKDGPQEQLPHQLAFHGVMDVLADGPALTSQIQVGFVQSGNGCLQPLGELQVFLQEHFVRIAHTPPNSRLAA